METLGRERVPGQTRGRRPAGVLTDVPSWPYSGETTDLTGVGTPTTYVSVGGPDVQSSCGRTRTEAGGKGVELYTPTATVEPSTRGPLLS